MFLAPSKWGGSPKTKTDKPVASRPLGHWPEMARPLIRQVGPGQAELGCFLFGCFQFHDGCLSENKYFDQLHFSFDCHCDVPLMLLAPNSRRVFR